MLYLLAALGRAEIVRLVAVGVAWVVRGDAPCPMRPRRDAPTRRRGAATVDEPAAPAPCRRAGGAPSRASASSRSPCSRPSLATIALVHRAERAGLPPVLGRVQLHRLRERRRERLTAKSFAEYRAFIDTAERASARPHAVGRRRRDRRVRHAARADAAAVLDRRAHPVDGGPVLRGVGDHAVPLHDGRRRSRSTPSNPVRGLPYRSIADFDLGVQLPPAPGRPLLRGVRRRRRTRRRREPAPRRSRPCPTSTASRRRAGRSTGSPTADACRPLQYEPVVVDGMHVGTGWKCEGVAEAGRPGGPSRRVSPWECTAVPWFNDPDALDRPLTDDGPAVVARASPADARTAAKQAAARRSRSRTSARPSLGRVRRVAHRRPGDGEDVVLPELGGRRRRRPVAGHAQLHGRRPHRAGT